jgi:hypothetical protein
MKFFFQLICFGAAAGAALAFFSPFKTERAAQQQVQGLKVSALANSTNTSAVFTTVDLREIVLENIMHTAEIHSVEATYDLQIPVTLNREVYGFEVGSTTLDYQAQGVVKAGVDLSRINQEDLSIVGGLVILQMPAAQFFDVYVDVSESSVIETRRMLGPGKTAEALVEAQKEAHAQINELACSSDILEQAAQQAAVILKPFVAEVQITPSSECQDGIAELAPEAGQ